MKAGYELELLCPPGLTRLSVAQAIASKFKLALVPCFHRESELWPGADNATPYYCLTKGFELFEKNQWQFRVVNDMTVKDSIDLAVTESPEWFHVLTDDIRFIDLIRRHCNAGEPCASILSPIARLFNSEVKLSDGIYSVTGLDSKLVCGAHSKATDRNRICEIVTAPITENHHEKLSEILQIATSMGCVVPKEGAFHIHFDGEPHANSSGLLRVIRYFYVWSDVLKALIPPNPHCTRLGEYSAEIVDYSFNRDNALKDFARVKSDLKALSPTKYCDFNFTNILIGNLNKFTIEVRVIPMLLDSAALSAASDLYSSFMNFISTSNVGYKKQKLKANAKNIKNLFKALNDS